MEMNQGILKQDFEISSINHILRSDVRGRLLGREDHPTFNQHLTTPNSVMSNLMIISIIMDIIIKFELVLIL